MPAQEVMIAVMGATGSGKSTFINLVSGSNLPVSNKLKSCTVEVQESKLFTLDDRTVSMIDTPGFDDTDRSDTDILESISKYIAQVYRERVTLAGVIYLHRISDVRMGGTSRRNFHLFRKLCGDDSLRNVLIVTTMWSNVNKALAEAREEELTTSADLFKPVLDKGAQMLRHDGTLESAKAILRRLIVREGTVLCIQKELVDEGKDFAHTAVAMELSAHLMERISCLEGEIKQLREEISRLTADDAETRSELGAELAKREDEKNRVEGDRKRLTRPMALKKGGNQRQSNTIWKRVSTFFLGSRPRKVSAV